MNIFGLDHVAVNHVDRFQLVQVQLIGCRGTAIFDHDYAEAFIGEAAHGRADALMFLEFRGRASENLTTPSPASAAAPQVAAEPGANRGRY